MISFQKIAAIIIMTAFLPTQALALSFNNKLVDAADQGNVEDMSQLLRAGMSVNSKGDFDVTPLMRTAYRGYTDITRRLLERGAGVNYKDIGGATALHLAVRQGHQDVVTLLLEYGASVDMADNEGWTPLMRSALLGRDEIMVQLLENGADPYKKNNFGEDALLLAERAGIVFEDEKQEVAAQEEDVTEDVAVVAEVQAAPENVKSEYKSGTIDLSYFVPPIFKMQQDDVTQAVEKEVYIADASNEMGILKDEQKAYKMREAQISEEDVLAYESGVQQQEEQVYNEPIEEVAQFNSVEVQPYEVDVSPVVENQPVAEEAYQVASLPEPTYQAQDDYKIVGEGGETYSYEQFLTAPTSIEIVTEEQLRATAEPYYLIEIGRVGSMAKAKELINDVYAENGLALINTEVHVLGAVDYAGRSNYRVRLGAFQSRNSADNICNSLTVSNCRVIKTSLLPPTATVVADSN